MKLYVGVTDYQWYKYLAESGSCSDINFWRPSIRQPFKVLSGGEMFLFKLHAPSNQIVGGAFFTRYLTLSLSMAWDTFGTCNGAESLETMRQSIERYGRRSSPIQLSQQIGCIVLSEPFFFAPDRTIAMPSDFAPNVVQGKSYDLASGNGKALYYAVGERLAELTFLSQSAQSNVVSGVRYGTPGLIAPRLGQAGFRIMVSEAYQRRCAITGERTLPALEAAHIQPYGGGGPHTIDNGLLLRSDLHRLFDQGYWTIDPDDRKVVVSAKIHEEFKNGREYYALHGRPILSTTPEFPGPSTEYLRFHAERVFLG